VNNRPKPSLFPALSVVLPTPEETLLLRACLFSGNDAQNAWQEWRRRSNVSTNRFLGDDESVKKLRPLVFGAQNLHGLEVDKESQTYLRSAFLQEELRGKIILKVCRDILQLFESERIPTIVLKGVALAETVYANPAHRHCHDIDLMIKVEDVGRAVSRLSSIGFKGTDSRLEHESKVALELHTSLFTLDYHNGTLPEMWHRGRNQSIAGFSTRILAPADNLLHVCGHAFYESRRGSLRWVSDAWLIMDRHRDLDWDLLVDCAERSHLAIPLSVTLEYLAEHLSAPIPSSVLNRLFALAEKSDATQRELALFGARLAPKGSLNNLFRKMEDWRGRLFLLRWLFFPTPNYLVMVEKVGQTLPLPLQYVYRPIRYALRRARNPVGGLYGQHTQRT
jgi:hypothetical protein